MHILGAIVAGIVGTIVMTMVIDINRPNTDIVDMLGSMFYSEGNRILGTLLHIMIGTTFAIIYVVLWNAGIGSASLLWGAVFGAIHWLIAGAMLGGLTIVHAGVKAGTMNAPGIYMRHNNGIMAFADGLLGHIIFGIAVSIIYGLFV